MFTVGIFSTHLPYIAFVTFYAYFFLVGIPKASGGDLSSDESVFSFETNFVQKYDFSDQYDYNIDQISQVYFYHSTNSVFTSEKKLLFLNTHQQKVKQNLLSYSEFCRPPPEA